MYFFETLIFIIGAAILAFIGYVFGKKGTDAFKDLKEKLKKNKK